MTSSARYLPARPFPPYAFLPGRDPHPVRDPEGHSYGEEEGPAGYFDARDWRVNEDYLYGIDLYNHGFLWEAHEAWEGLWHVAKPDEHQALFLQGLIQCTAAVLKVRMGQPRGLARLGALGLEKLTTVARAHGGSYMGLDVFSFVAELQAFVDHAPSEVDGRPLLELEGLTAR